MSGQTKVWQGIEAADPPCLRHDYTDLLAMAQQLRDTRRERFPAMVESGKIAADEATRQQALFDQIADHWRWICSGEGEPATHATIHDRTDALDESLRTIASIASKRGGFSQELAHQAHCLIALRWHHEPSVDLAMRATARLTHQSRADARAKLENVHAH